MRRVVALSGPLYSGKSTIALALGTTCGAMVVSVREMLRQMSGVRTRAEMQIFGADLEARTAGTWLARGVRDAVREPSEAPFVVVDSVRTVPQAVGLRDAYGSNIGLVFVDATEEVRRRRYLEVGAVSPWESSSFDAAMGHPVERGVEAVRAISDLCIDTTSLRIDDAVQQVLEFSRGAG